VREIQNIVYVTANWSSVLEMGFSQLAGSEYSKLIFQIAVSTKILNLTSIKDLSYIDLGPGTLFSLAWLVADINSLDNGSL
jgi:hypothetical protein